MTRITKAQSAGLETQLRQLAARLRNEIADAMKANGTPDVIGLANHNEDVDDAALADLQTSLDLASVQRDIQELREAEAALKRLRDDSYGTCIACGHAVALARLQASPAAARCIGCQEQAERARGEHSHRSL